MNFEGGWGKLSFETQFNFFTQNKSSSRSETADHMPKVEFELNSILPSLPPQKKKNKFNILTLYCLFTQYSVLSCTSASICKPFKCTTRYSGRDLGVTHRGTKRGIAMLRGKGIRPYTVTDNFCVVFDL